MRFAAFSVTSVLLLSVVSALGPNLVCYYDSSSHDRSGYAKFSIVDLEVALQFCTHVIYGYVGIMPETLQMTSINQNLDIHRRHMAEFTALKEKFPSVKFLLSVGGNKDFEQPEKYMELLEGGRVRQQGFIQSARDLVRSYNFDGLDLAFQFPLNKARKVHSPTGTQWKNFKKLFTGDFVVDKLAEEHKQQFTDLVASMKNVFAANNLMLSLTVLPNVNSTWYFNAPAIINNLDMVNLATFDFLTPERNPEEADFTANLYELHDQNRLGHYSINYQVEHWTQQRVPSNKINVGIAAYGRAWKLTSESGSLGTPVVPKTAGPAPAGPITRTPGLLNWMEVCAKLRNPTNARLEGEEAPLQRVADPLKRSGTYAYRPADANGDHGLWVSYEEPDTAATKAAYVKVKNLGGVAFFDLSLDDFLGQCTGDKFPMLRAIKYRLT